MFQGLSIADTAFTITAGTPFAPNRAVGVYVGGAGDVSLNDVHGTTVVFKGVPAGSILPILTTAVNSSGTTATNLLGLK